MSVDVEVSLHATTRYQSFVYRHLWETMFSSGLGLDVNLLDYHTCPVCGSLICLGFLKIYILARHEESMSWNARIIEEFRRNHGKVGGHFEGAPLLLLDHVGARTGKKRVNPVMYLKDGERYVVFASNGGADTNPDWYY